MSTLTRRLLGNGNDRLALALLALVIFVVLPLSMDIFRLNLVGKYLTYAFVAVGLVLCWGYGGILSLGQGIFFGLGGYCMAMFLKLEASDPVSTAIQSTPGIRISWTGISSPRCRGSGYRSRASPSPCSRSSPYRPCSPS